VSTATVRAYPALGFDPAPGATERIGALATDLGSVASELGAARQALMGIGRSGGIWQGDAAEAFHRNSSTASPNSPRPRGSGSKTTPT
jgi:hypothetical protein